MSQKEQHDMHHDQTPDAPLDTKEQHDIQQRVSELKHQIATTKNEELRSDLQEEFDNIVAAECILCGQMMIACVSERLDLEHIEEQAEWTL